ncbi:hypothetical protein K470DRAFT_220539 [Piedraia hortae CBS 480.64]|uniref:Uncharacterized protein n=1 Tax=Piedraia hortae CBS 480.64 TaxID=1314780 RepID=A0A6A7BUZ9_9PEZI|nr:hypothetical protein K470DRAFT_220539 [Piedraia hortae CBS 480.64]
MDGEPRARGLTSHSNRSMGAGDHSEHELAHGGGHRDSLLKNTNKANPNAALSEAQPVVVNLTEQVTLESLRAHQHKDSNGNPITDPDLSNPTRPRLERPLETIRSFERAIDAGYKRRSAHIPRSGTFGNFLVVSCTDADRLVHG